MATHVEQYQTPPLLKDITELQEVSRKNDIPEEDILLITLNCSGINVTGIDYRRGRFPITMPSGREYFLALTFTGQPLSPFLLSEGVISLAGTPIASAGPIEQDTCTSSYWRSAKTHLTLNSNSRSNCRGCKFCGTYGLEKDDEILNTSDALRRKAETLAREKGTDLTEVQSVGIVTGCFPDERRLLDHLTLVRSIFMEFGFKGEVRYIGSQLKSIQALQDMASQGPFALFLTVEAFERREQLMKKIKASLDLEQGRQLLASARELGINTSFLYIAGLDTLEAIQKEFPKYSGLLTKNPLVQTFQVYQPEQIQWRDSSAAKLDYYLQTRKIVEQVFPNQIPDGSSNYRGLWYTTYANRQLPNCPI